MGTQTRQLSDRFDGEFSCTEQVFDIVEQTVGDLMTSSFKSNFSEVKMMTVPAIQALAGKPDTGTGLAKRKMAEEIFAGAFDMHFMTTDGADSFPVFKIQKNTGKTDHLAGLRLVRMNRNVTPNKAFETWWEGKDFLIRKRNLNIGRMNVRVHMDLLSVWIVRLG